MRALLNGLFLSAALALPLVAAAAEPATPSPAEPTASAAPAKKICRKERRTGSQMLTKVCRTPEQIEAEREAAREALVNRPGSNLSQPAPSGNL